MALRRSAECSVGATGLNRQVCRTVQRKPDSSASYGRTQAVIRLCLSPFRGKEPNGKRPGIMHMLKTLLGFNGELSEPGTGHYLLGSGYRAFSPVLMIFMQPDSWSPFGAGGLNAYAYCEGDPVNAADPTGHMPFRLFFQSGRVSRPPSPPRYNIPPVLRELTGSEVVQTLAGLASHPVPGSSAGRVLPDPVWPSERFSPPQILAAPAVAQSSSALPTPAGSAGPSGGVVVPSRYNVNYQRLKTEISRMIRNNDAEGVIRLADEPFSRRPVYKELYRQLTPPAERRTGHATREQSPSISQRYLGTLRDRAQRDGFPEKARFYAKLRLDFTEKNRTRPRKN